jgi:hypothetical protein
MGGAGAYLLFICVSKKGGVLERGGLNIEITVPPFLPLPSQTCCRRGGNCRVDVLHVMYLVIWSDELVNISLPIISC